MAATHGGTLFVVLYKGRLYGLTCRHVLKEFGWSQLVVTDKRFGSQIAGLQAIAYPSQPKRAAIDTDILDVAIIQFSNDVDNDFFTDAPYVLDEKTIVTSQSGDILNVAGALKAMSSIDTETIAPVYCILEMSDDTMAGCSDPTLRRAVGQFDKPEFSDVLGLSGSPVFNLTQSALCGMVVRGTMVRDECSLWYVDMFDIGQLIAAVHAGEVEAYYRKTLIRMVMPEGE